MSTKKSAKRMSEYEAWIWMAKKWEGKLATFESTMWLGSSSCQGVSLRRIPSHDGKCYGLCNMVNWLFRAGKISDAKRERMKRKITAAVRCLGNSPYPFAWKCDTAGAQQRAAFCRQQAEELRPLVQRSKLVSANSYVKGVLQADKLAALPARCDGVKEYTGQRKPRCSSGKGCRACWDIYLIKHPEEDYRGSQPNPTPCH